MTDKQGGFYSAEDADSPLAAGKPEHAEGAFYIWTSDQIRQALVGLGWAPSQADQAVGLVFAELNGEPAPAVPVLLKRAIQALGRAR